jgi:PAS domain S-box-containing protein
VSDAPTTANPTPGIVRILLVEDDEGSARLLEIMLARWRYGAFDTRRAGSLSAAFREVAQGGIDIVLLDLGLPDSQGFDTFIRMRAAATHVPIVILSGLDDEALATESVQKGAQDYIVKGQADGPSLARAIRYAIERFRAQQAVVREHDILRSVIENIPDQVYLKDTDSRFVTVNPVVARFFGASSPDEIVGKCDFDFFPREMANQFLAEEQALLRHDQPCINREAAVTDSAGNEKWVLTTKMPLHDHAGNITGLLGINRDITDRKKAEEVLRRTNAELEERVAERTSELSDAVALLRKHDQARTEFVSSVSHELKTPLTSMMFAISNLLEGVVGPVSEPVTELLCMIDADCRRMTGTVEDILDFSRLEAKTMRLHRAKLLFDRLVRHAATALTSQARTKNIEIALSIGQTLGFVECDAPKTMRAIINVIGNAIKFTSEGGKVEVGLRREAGAPDALVVEITDNGIGIAPHHLGRVTEKYFRAGEHVSGAGLGLSIAKEIVELHGGRLTIQSPPPDRVRGTRVSVSMPTVEAPTVLIVNDDAPTRDLIEQQLSAHGYRVVACAGGDDTLDLARRTRPDVGILDVSTLGAGEADLVLRMKADQDLRTIPIVAVNGGIAGPAKQAVLNGLGIPMLPKPWREDDLLDRIETAIKGMSPKTPTT